MNWWELVRQELDSAWAYVALGTGASFLLLALMFHPLEKAFPAKRGQKFFRPEWWVDLLFFLGQSLLWGGLVLWVLSNFADWLDLMMPEGFRAAVADFVEREREGVATDQLFLGERTPFKKGD